MPPASSVIYLKIAAQNYNATVFDSDDLSTTRGGSLALLQVPRRLHAHLKCVSLIEGLVLRQVTAISTGASEGVFALVPNLPPELQKPKPAKPKGMSTREWCKQQALMPQEPGGDPEAFYARVADAYAAACRDFLRSARIHANADNPNSPAVSLNRFLFAVATCTPKEHGDNLKTALRCLETGLRLQQFRRPTVVIPHEAPPPDDLDITEDPRCRLTGLHPAEVKGPRGLPVSRSAAERQAFGRDQKFHFYQQELARLITKAEEFATPARDAAPDTHQTAFAEQVKDALERTLQSLKSCEVGFAVSFVDMALPEHAPDLPAAVPGKMALIYLDGNNFGSRRKQATRDQLAGQRFSTALELWRGRLLAALLDWIMATPAMIRPATDADPHHRFRFETLLWGGDEVLWVMPAAFAWEAMAVIQRALKGWRPGDFLPEMEGGSVSLSHSAGLLLCDHKAPIRVVRHLASALCDAAKHKEAHNGQSAEANFVQVLALEGADWAGLDIAAYRAARFGPVPAAAFSLEGARWEETTQAARHIRRVLGQSLSHRLLRDAAADDAPDAETGQGLSRRLAARVAPDQLEEVTKFLAPDGPLCRATKAYPLLPLYQLLHFWDYIDPFEKGEKAP